MIASVITMLVLFIFYEIGFYRGRCSAKDKEYIKGYRDGINDGGKSIQEIISKIKEE